MAKHQSWAHPGLSFVTCLNSDSDDIDEADEDDDDDVALVVCFQVS